MMPRTLNVEKLEKKFSSLTKSRESIQGLSSWIMRHKENCKEIVDQWLMALARDTNTLAMFYVANDVILNCSRKRAAEYVGAFSFVLERAISLQKIKQIQNEVRRLLTIWREREIYDTVFLQRLDHKLSAEIEDEKKVDEVKIPEAEVIANFKLQNVIDSVQKEKKLGTEVENKGKVLRSKKMPKMPHMDNLIVQMSSQKELKKWDSYCKFLEEYVQVANVHLETLKAELRELENTDIFYSVQNEEVRTVVHAYRIYGKKLKILSKSLSEKVPSLPEMSPVHIHETPAYEHFEEISIPLPDSSLLEPKVFTEEASNEDNKILENQEVINVEEDSSASHDSKKLFNECEEYDKNENCLTSVEQSTSVCKENTPEMKESEVVVGVLCTETTTNEEIKQKASESTEKYADDVDFLLEKCYDIKQTKCKSSLKRKIESLLKFKGAKIPKSNESEKSPDNFNNNDDKNISPKSDTTFTLQQETPEDTKECPMTEIKLEESSIKKDYTETVESNILPEKSDFLNVNSSEEISDTEKLVTSIKMENASDSPKQEENNFHSAVLSSTSANKNLSNNSALLQHTVLPTIPTELLKNILDKNRANMKLSNQETVPFENMENLNNESSFPDLNSENSFIDAIKSEQHEKQAIKYEEVKNVSCKTSEDNVHSLFSDNHTMVSVKDENSQFINNAVNCSNLENKIDVSQELLTENKSLNVNKTALVFNECSKSKNIPEEPNSNKVTPDFMKSIKNVVYLLSKDKLSYNKNSESHVPSLADIPIENTLHVYRYIMKSYGSSIPFTRENQNSLQTNCKVLSNLSTATSMSISSTESFMKSSIPKSTETQYVTVTGNEQCSLQESQVISGKNINICSDSGKNDNLEVMDMDVDSSD